MKKIISIILFLNSFSCIFADQSENDQLLAVQKVQILDVSLLMVGMGLTQTMNDDYYIGAFYMDDTAGSVSEEDLAYLDRARRMEFRFISDYARSGRSFSRSIAESISINNSRDEISEAKPKLQTFLRLFKGSYKKGDVLRFDYHPSFGTKIILNDSSLGEIKDSQELYSLLVNIWVGERPPSSSFKVGIIGENDGDYAVKLLKRFVKFN